MSDPHAHATSHAQSELDADEPRTPMWLPLLGGSLFLAAAIFAIATSSNEPAETKGAEGATAEVKAAPPNPSDAPAPAPSPRINVRRVPDQEIQRGAPPAGVPGQPAPGQPAPGQPAPRMVLPAQPAPRVMPPPGACCFPFLKKVHAVKKKSPKSKSNELPRASKKSKPVGVGLDKNREPIVPGCCVLNQNGSTGRVVHICGNALIMRQLSENVMDGSEKTLDLHAAASGCDGLRDGLMTPTGFEPVSRP